jgi:feruloyl-CoA synthase
MPKKTKQKSNGRRTGMNSAVPFKKLNRPSPDISVIKRDDGSYLIESNIAIGAFEKNVGTYWRRAAIEFPERAFLVQCSEKEVWPELTYGEATRKADQISTWLINNGYSSETPILILSSNSFAHAILSLAALQIGVPIVPVSPAYSLMSGDFEKLRYAVDLVQPKMVFAESGIMFGKALDVISSDIDVVVTAATDRDGALGIEELLSPVESDKVDAAFDKVDGNTLAKILFTSGSTGMPKAVPNTQEMLCSAQKMQELIGEPRDPINDHSIVLDWLPWHHTYGGNANLLGTIRLAGTMYLDDGKPIPGLFDRTISNLKRIKPTRFSSVPTAFSFLLDQLETDDELATAFFERVKICQYGGAALSQELFERMQDVSIKYTGLRMPFGTGWGSTETTAMGTAVYWDEDRVGLIGVPYSGVKVKLVPVAQKFEIRVTGPHVHKGYYKRPDLTEAYFDDEGFYCIGDAVNFMDPEKPTQGLVFSGRVSEDFKLANGTWVETGSLRLSLIDAMDPLVRDVVIAGQDEENIGILIIPGEGTMSGVRERGYEADNPLSLVNDKQVLAAISEKLKLYNARNGGRSRHVAHAAVMGFALSSDKNEITDKQYINQSAVLQNRAPLVEQLFKGTSTEVLHF